MVCLRLWAGAGVLQTLRWRRRQAQKASVTMICGSAWRCTKVWMSQPRPAGRSTMRGPPGLVEARGRRSDGHAVRERGIGADFLEARFFGGDQFRTGAHTQVTAFGGHVLGPRHLHEINRA